MKIMTRYKNNPILKPEDMPFDCFAVYNGGAVKIDDEYIMLVRCEDMARRQYTWAARSQNGYNFTPDPKPVVFVAENMELYNEYADKSWYDPRINAVEGQYYITYAASSDLGCMVGIGETKDFKTIRHVSFPHHPQNRNGVLFPDKFEGMYALLHRPETGSIWISYSPDLKYWGDSRIVVNRGISPWNELNGHASRLKHKATMISRWNNFKIGAGAPPIRTEKGWLLITHAVCASCAGHYYTMGAVLLDLKNPSKLIGLSDGAIMRPETEYEQTGFVPNVIFPCGAILEDDGSMKIYYGAADNYECLVESRLSDILDKIRPL